MPLLDSVSVPTILEKDKIQRQILASAGAKAAAPKAKVDTISTRQIAVQLADNMG